MTLEKEDLDIIKNRLGREPNEVETEFFVNLWSEHCAYRSSRPVLSSFVTEGENVVIGPGDDAGVIELPNGELLALAIESHNHPSYIDPYNGAATGVGGIVRDVLSMGARPIALLDPLRFGDLEEEKNRYLLEGVVDGISSYGNSIGVPTVGGEVEFDSSYNGNPLVNAFCVGIVENLLTAKATTPDNPLLLVGASTGRDGLGGASFASQELEEDSDKDRPNVQVGDPFTEKLLVDCILEMAEDGLIEACRDLGAAGLGGASSEMCSLGGYGAEIDLNKVHLREENMHPLEILLSESQERMLVEIKPENIDKATELTEKYDLESNVVGKVIEEEQYIALYNQEKVVDVPIKLLTDEAPTYTREHKEDNRSEKITSRTTPPTKEALTKLMANPNIASKEWIYSQYDHEVQIRTVIKPGSDSAVLKLDEGGVALTTGCNSHHTYLDPSNGGKGSVLINAMNLATVGARPIAMVDCLNFGNPEREDIYWEFKKTVEGMAEMAEKMNIPVVGGNVSLYNESAEYGSTVKPTPNIGMVGWIPEVNQTPNMKVSPGDHIYIYGETRPELGASQYFKEIYQSIGENPPKPRQQDINNIENMVDLVRENDLSMVRSISRGGLITALSKTAVKNNVGIKTDLTEIQGNLDKEELLFSESYGRFLIATEEKLDIEDSNLTKIGQAQENKLEVKVIGEKNTWSLKELENQYNYIKKLMKG
ncbi:Phosphoribosylformylglycinamidine (FGAM) synthase synthetase domain [Methanonatronarchaeum thermophilum]|uniref:Phosphoribosylformylglycinamidine synthase subunit PurL n=1 Tax=Methanonatronarchaeum thermophilum TaxID=1927129 RepID=A0A1Y3GCF7_9EURY|nr:phosphoribosylformylglycinamidine synthase subunit PurL [Methanonatronarchaeum thermophilum]OUJ19141.1 Phosphoribosylformylglycinamidine (FGAM) synthase synthetase domain [Methanonatronarchaeum thermophilum]